jgi:ribosomal protein S11
MYAHRAVVYRTKSKAHAGISSGAHFRFFNNTIVTVTDAMGIRYAGAVRVLPVIRVSKSTPFAARLAAEHAIKTAQTMGVQEVDLIIKGPVRVANLRFVPFKGWDESSFDFGYYSGTA